MSTPLGQLAGMGRISADLNRALESGNRHAQEKQNNIESINYLADIQRASTAAEFCARLENQMKHFDAELDAEHEVGVRLVTFGQTITFHVSKLGYHNPSLIFFYGETPEGDKVQLIQHVSQISFVLMAMPKPDPEQPKRPFGFAQGENVQGDAEAAPNGG
jgi:hypothetical protein